MRLANFNYVYELQLKFYKIELPFLKVHLKSRKITIFKVRNPIKAGDTSIWGLYLYMNRFSYCIHGYVSDLHFKNKFVHRSVY